MVATKMANLCRIPQGAMNDTSLEDLIGQAEHWQGLGMQTKAIDLYQAWLNDNQQADRFIAWFNLGVLFHELAELHKAAQAYENSIALEPGFDQAQINLGLVFERQQKYTKAFRAWQQVAQSNLQHHLSNENTKLMALNHMGRLHESQKQFGAAEKALRQSLKLKPQQPDVLQHWVFLRMKQCEWPVFKAMPGLSVHQQLTGLSPLAMLALQDDPALQLMSAKLLHKRKYDHQHQQQRPIYKHAKTRVAYLSGDLCTHAVGLLLAPVIEAHNRAQFEIHAIDFSPEDSSLNRIRLLKAFDHVHKVQGLSDAQIAALIRSLEIDVLVDLHGLSAGAKPAVLAHQPASLQGTYLGFIGTCAMPWHDFVVTDHVAAPPVMDWFYVEQALHLPTSFIPLVPHLQPMPPSTKPTQGLPIDAVVLACFNNVYKLNPGMFDIWMRVLTQHRHAVLWLLDDNPQATQHLKAQAVKAGVKLDQLVFASRTNYHDYLMRLSVVDLYLDTFPYNAGSTGRDVLMAGVPMVTLMGNTMVSRMAASMLSALGMQGLIAQSAQGYEDKINELLREPKALEQWRRRLHSRLTRHQTSAQQIAKGLEQGWTKMLKHVGKAV